jgi:hypothetical protein
MEEVMFSENGFKEPKKYLSPHNNFSKFKTSTKKKKRADYELHELEYITLQHGKTGRNI